MSPQQNRIVVLMLSFFAQISPRRGKRMKIRNLNANKMFNLRYLLILFVLLAGLPFRASAQNATIVGTVTEGIQYGVSAVWTSSTSPRSRCWSQTSRSTQSRPPASPS